MAIMTPSKTEAPTVFQNRLDFIEALRGWAALYVVIFHLVGVSRPPLDTPFWASPIISLGGSGVTLFFIVSAFTLTFSMRLHEKQAHPVRRFYLRRIFRIIPLFYVWMVLSWFREILFYHKTASLTTVLLSASFTFNLVPGYQLGLVWASWTIGVEMLFYLFFPLIYRYINNLQKACIFFISTLILSSIYTYLFSHYLHVPAAQFDLMLKMSFLHQFPVFAMGIIVFYLFEEFIQNKPISQSWAFLLFALSAFAYSALLDGRLNFFLDATYWQAIIYSLLLLGLAISPVRLLVNRISLFAGKLSYSIYLNHYSFVIALTPIFSAIYTWPLPVEFKFLACFLLILVLLIPISYITYRLIERPGMQLGTRLIQKFASESVDASVTDASH